MDIDNDKENIRLAYIDKQRPAIPNQTLQNRLLSKSSSTFKEVIFSKSQFSAGTLILNTRYKHPGNQNNNLFYPFNDQVNYALAHYFPDSKTTKQNVYKFFTNLLIKSITKNLLYLIIEEQMKNLSAISQGIPNNKQIKQKFELKSGVDKVAGKSPTL